MPVSLFPGIKKGIVEKKENRQANKEKKVYKKTGVKLYTKVLTFDLNIKFLYSECTVIIIKRSL